MSQMARVRFKAIGKVLLIIIAIPLVIVAATNLKNALKKPSPEILRLRQVEKGLSLPAPKERHEEDSGCHRSPLGTYRYERYVLLYYDDLNMARQVKNILESKKWHQNQSSSQNSDNQSYYFTNESQNASASIQLQPLSKDRLPHSVFIESLSEDKCESAP